MTKFLESEIVKNGDWIETIEVEMNDSDEISNEMDNKIISGSSSLRSDRPPAAEVEMRKRLSRMLSNDSILSVDENTSPVQPVVWAAEVRTREIKVNDKPDFSRGQA